MDESNFWHESGAWGRYQILQLLNHFFGFVPVGALWISPAFTTNRQSYSCQTFRSEIFVHNNTDSLEAEGICQREELCGQWNFSQEPLKLTIQSRYQLVCSKDFLIDLSSSIFFIGFAFGTLVYGLLADRHGRRLAILVGWLHTTVLATLIPLAPTSTYYIIGRSLVGLGAAGVTIVPITYLAEITDRQHRPVLLFMRANGAAIGGIALPLIAWLLPDQKAIEFSIAILMVICSVGYIRFQESPLWLVAKGRHREAQNVMLYIARVNGHLSNDQKQENHLEDAQNNAGEGENASSKILSIKNNDYLSNRSHNVTLSNDNFINSISNLHVHLSSASLAAPPLNESYIHDKDKLCNKKSRVAILWFIKITIVQFFLNMFNSMTYFFVSLAIGLLGGNIFINGVIVLSSEPLARLLGMFVCRYFTRRRIICVLMFCGTISLVTCGLLIGKDQLRLVLVSAAMFAKTFAGISWDVANIYANEIYPTKVRTFGSSCCQSACHVGSTLAPIILLLVSSRPGAIMMPYYGLGVCQAVCAILMLLIMPDPADSKNSRPQNDTEALTAV